jgi:hypothetical protein
VGKTANLTVSVDPGLKADVDRLAELENKTRSKTVSDRLGFALEFDSEFLRVCQDAADELKIPVTIFIQNLLTAHFAAEKAFLEVFGHNSPRATAFLRYRDGRLLQGDELAEVVKTEALEMCRKAKQEALEESQMRLFKTEGLQHANA